SAARLIPERWSSCTSPPLSLSRYEAGSSRRRTVIMAVGSCPPWAQHVANEVCRLIHTPSVRQRWNDQVRAWAYRYVSGWTEHHADDFELLLKRRGRFQNRPFGANVLINLERRQFELDEKYALLAVIHNACTSADEIAPWDDESVSPIK